MTRSQALILLVNHIEHDFYELDQLEFMQLANKHDITVEDILECLSDETINQITPREKPDETKQNEQT